jgi:hypothetical protein
MAMALVSKKTSLFIPLCINLNTILRIALILILRIAIPLIWISLQYGLEEPVAVQGHSHFHLLEVGHLQLMMLDISMASLLN